MPKCFVSFTDFQGFGHRVEVVAESLYEAGARAIRVFREHGYEPSDHDKLQVEISDPVIHTITPKKIYEHIERGMKAPKDVVLSDKLRAILCVAPPPK